MLKSRNAVFVRRHNGVESFAYGVTTLCKDLRIRLQIRSTVFLTFGLISPPPQKSELLSECACVSDPRHKRNPIYLDNLAALSQQTHSF